MSTAGKTVTNHGPVALYRCAQFHHEALLREMEWQIAARANFKDYLENLGLTDLQRAATPAPEKEILSAEPAQNSPAKSLPASHLFLVGTARKSPQPLDICSHNTPVLPAAGHLLKSAMSSLCKPLSSRLLTPPRAK